MVDGFSHTKGLVDGFSQREGEFSMMLLLLQGSLRLRVLTKFKLFQLPKDLGYMGGILMWTGC
jgi:hypothetical protein